MVVKRILFFCLIAVSLLVASGAILVNSWRNTPQGKLTWMSAIMVKVARGPIPYYQKNQSPKANRERFSKDVALAFGSKESITQIRNILIPGREVSIPARVYVPQNGKSLPVILMYHGGGWVFGSLDGQDNLCRRIANSSGAVVVSVDYRMAPEHPFPAAVDDAYESLVYVAENIQEFSGDPEKIVVMGDSAGGNLAAVMAQMARDRDGPTIAYQVLVYPVTNCAELNTASYTDFARGFMLTKRDMEEYIALYLPNPVDRKDKYASPLLADDFESLPPALVITAQFDVLRDDGEAYAKKLREAGVPVQLHRYEGVLHGFMNVDRWLPESDLAVDEVGAALKKHFATRGAK